MFFSFGGRIILLVLVVAGIVAYVGDLLGRSIGRKRLTILKLRPRHTAAAFTVITGALIAFCTIILILSISQDARTAFFGLEELKSQVAEKTWLLQKTKDDLATRIGEREKIDQELLTAKTEIRALEKTRQKLKKEIRISRQGTVLFKVGDTLLTSVIQAGPERKKLETGLRQILSAADTYIRSFGVKTKKHLVFISPQEFEITLSALQARTGENIVSVIATRNSVWGENIPVRIEISENELIYKAGDVVGETMIADKFSTPEIEQEIKKFLFTIHQSAKKAGVIPDPNGSVGSVAYSQIFSLSKKIKSHKKGVNLRAFAKDDVYAIGPLELQFRVYYQ